MKTAMKWVGGLLGATVLVGALGLAQVWYFKPFKVGIFYELSFLKNVLDDPEALSSLRILPPALDWYNDDLTEATPARQMRRAAMARKNLEMLHGYDRASMTESEQ